MPFTLSHMVLAPPLHRLSKQRLPLAALSIGCMTPDLYRLFTSQTIDITHQWLGIISYDLVLGLLLCCLWYLLYRPVLFQFLNLHWPLRLHHPQDYLIFILMSALAIMLGSTTHIIWDGVTHLDARTFAFHDFLAQTIIIGSKAFPLHSILQISCSILALPILLLMCRHYLNQHRANTPVLPWINRYAIILLSCSFLAGCLAYYQFTHNLSLSYIQTHLYDYIGRSLNHFASYFLVTFSVGCVLFKIIRRQKSNPTNFLIK